MSFQRLPASVPVQTFLVYPARAFRVSHGVAQDDPIATADELVLEDIYQLAEGQDPLRLSAAVGLSGNGAGLSVAERSATGRPGAPLHLDALLTFMGPHGTTAEVLVLVETDEEGLIAAIYAYPLAPLTPKTGYTLVTVDRAAAGERLAESACVAFTKGTHITMADGQQVPVEALRVGDRVLSRDCGPQAIRWIGSQTMRATGAFAPITIAPGTLNNTGELTVSPNHRLFIYQRVDEMGAGQSEIMVRAAHLVNGLDVVKSEGGFVEYFQLLFDKHEIIFAEGIAAESLFVDPATGPMVPEEVRARLAGEARPEELGLELPAGDLARSDALRRLRRASLR